MVAIPQAPLRFDRFMCRRYTGHPLHSKVDVFYKDFEGNKVILTKSFKKDFGNVSSNVLLSSNNHLISYAISKAFNCKSENTWITIPKHLGNVLHMDFVVLMNTYCDVRSRDQIWDLCYYTSSVIPEAIFRLSLQHPGSSSDDDDLSDRP